MSYTKLNIRYTTDGCNTKASVNTRDGEKHRTLALPKKVQEYGDANGYDSLSFDFNGDHLMIKQCIRFLTLRQLVALVNIEQRNALEELLLGSKCCCTELRE